MEKSASKPPIKRAAVRADVDWLARETAELLALDDVALSRKWGAVFGVDASPNFGRMFMLRSIAYRLQEKSLGGLSKPAQRILDQVCNDTPEVSPKRLPKTQVSTGTVLIREWRGVRHRVTVFDDDVVYRRQRYRSLSEVARLITGTRWSGPVFFGLRHRTKEGR